MPTISTSSTATEPVVVELTVKVTIDPDDAIACDVAAMLTQALDHLDDAGDVVAAAAARPGSSPTITVAAPPLFGRTRQVVVTAEPTGDPDPES